MLALSLFSLVAVGACQKEPANQPTAEQKAKEGTTPTDPDAEAADSAPAGDSQPAGNADSQPAEAKPAEAKPAEAKPAEAKPAEVKPAANPDAVKQPEPAKKPAGSQPNK